MKVPKLLAIKAHKRKQGKLPPRAKNGRWKRK